MTALTLRHYDATLGYRTSEFDRKVRDIKQALRTHIGRRALKRQLRAFLSRSG